MKLANSNHIVMVDDNEGDSHFAMLCWEEAGGTNPWLSLSSGPDFLEYMDRVRAEEAPMPALVLLDINMPGMTGLEVLRRTKHDPFFAALPIFCMLTSTSDPRDQALATDLGASGFMTKPDNVQGYVDFFRLLV